MEKLHLKQRDKKNKKTLVKSFENTYLGIFLPTYSLRNFCKTAVNMNQIRYEAIFSVFNLDFYAN